jgi:hypothetical protein
MSKNKKNIETVKSKCPHCKKPKVTFHLHECKRNYSEYFGCSDCDDWCVYCNINWNNYNESKKK